MTSFWCGTMKSHKKYATFCLNNKLKWAPNSIKTFKKPLNNGDFLQCSHILPYDDLLTGDFNNVYAQF